MAKVKFVAYCGMVTEKFDGTPEECQAYMNALAEKRKKQGYIVEVLDDGRIEIQQDENAVMVSDFEGVLIMDYTADDVEYDEEDEDAEA